MLHPPLGVPRTTPVRLSLAANFSWTLVGNVVYAGCQWGMLSAMAKLGAPELVGQFVLGLAVTSPVMMFSMLCLRAAQATDTKQEYAFEDYLSLRLITTPLAFLVICGITWIAGYRRDTALVIVMTGLAAIPEAISDIIYGLLQQRERMDRIATSALLKGPLSLAALAATMALTGSVLWSTLALALGRMLVVLAYDVPVAVWALRGSGCPPGVWAALKAVRPRWNARALRRLAWLCLPLGLVMMLLSLHSNIPRYFVEHYWGERDLGILAAMMYLMIVGSTLVNALGQSASPRLAHHFAVGDVRGFQLLLAKLMGIGSALGVAGLALVLLAGRPILALVYTPEYAERVDAFVWVAAAATLTYVSSFLGYGVTASRHFRVQVPLNCTLAAISALACWLLIPQYGLVGAAWALLATGLAQTAGAAVILLYVFRAAPPSHTD
jgi:O-antigen/teichoic acid export membrane protein